MDTAINLKWADGEYRFWLSLAQIVEIERSCGVKKPDGTVSAKSIFTIYQELYDGIGFDADGKSVFAGGSAAHAWDIREVIRCGLIGGGEGIVSGSVVNVSPIAAVQLVNDYTFPARPLSEGFPVAWAILHAAINGVDVKKNEPVKAPKPKRSPKAS